MENAVVSKSGFLWSCDIKAVSEYFFVEQKNTLKRLLGHSSTGSHFC